MASMNKRNNLRISEIMQEKGITLAELASRIKRVDKDGVERTLTSATLSARILGNPSLSNLYEIAEVLGVKITELFPEEDQILHVDNEKESPIQKTKREETKPLHTFAYCPHCGEQVQVGVVLL